MTEFENINSGQLTLEQEIHRAVAAAVEPLLQAGGWRTYTGTHQPQLAEQIGQLLGTSHVGLSCSGSAALELVLRACRLAAGDEVLLSAYDYPGNFTAIENCGARPALVDVAPDNWTLSRESLEATWNPACKALVVTHLHGQLQDMHGWRAWCRDRGVLLIQDACQAIGASIDGQPLGTWADATILSFGGSKLLSAGRGGAWCCNREDLAQHIRVAAGVGSGAFELSELQAAVVLAQLPFLERINAASRNYFASQMLRLQSQIEGLIVPWADQIETTAFYQAGWILPAGADRESLASLGQFGKGFDGFHRRSARRCRRIGELVNTARIVQRTVTEHHRFALS